MANYTAHITIEAKTPLKVGSNNSDFLQDAPVQKDWNALPMILGTSIAGVLRELYDGDKDKLFGFQKEKEDEGAGSKIIFSNALLLDSKAKVHEELLLKEKREDPILQIFSSLPIREHVKINDKGVVDGSAKFDEEVVYKGTRFKFAIELIEEDKASFNAILDLLHRASFRLGGGTTKGFGAFEIVEIKTTTKECSSSLNDAFADEGLYKPNDAHSEYIHYKLSIKPDDFFMFGSGFGDEDADMTPVYEKVVDYTTASLSDEKVLIPASSIKGALSHRTAFYYNKMMLQEQKEYTKVGEENDAVVAIFGHKKEKKENKELGQKGKVLFSDVFKPKKRTKVFDHVAIDRFTGGAIDGALFQEKTIADDGDSYELEILLHKSLEGSKAQKAFEAALKDITTGMLPLGGATTKGHGVFSGSITKDGEKL